MTAVGLLAPAAPERIDGQGPDAAQDLKLLSRVGLWAMRHVPSLVELFVKVVVGVVEWLVTKQWVINKMDRWFERSNERLTPDKEVSRLLCCHGAM